MLKGVYVGSNPRLVGQTALVQRFKDPSLRAFVRVQFDSLRLHEAVVQRTGFGWTVFKASSWRVRDISVDPPLRTYPSSEPPKRSHDEISMDQDAWELRVGSQSGWAP